MRGICCLRPALKGVSENIRVISIVGKYLEHARIFYFAHAQPSLYIASADWMPRNLERRLELMSPIYNENLQNKLKEILKLQLSDNELAFELQSSGEYQKIEPKKGEERINDQEFLEIYFNKIYKNIRKHDESGTALTKLLKES